MSEDPNPKPGDLHDLAKRVAVDQFATNQKLHGDAVCVIAVKVTEPGEIEYAFSGGVGYTKLCDDLGKNKKTDGHLITVAITDFLKSDAGSNFSDDQINRCGFDDHGRGAMNCAEPKMHHLIKTRGLDPANWALIPFHQDSDKNVVYYPPCKNCRRWVYGVFHGISKTIARNRGGADCVPGE